MKHLLCRACMHSFFIDCQSLRELLYRSSRPSDYIQGGQGANHGYLLLGVYARRTPGATLTHSRNHCVDADFRLPPPWFELQIFRLPGKYGYSTRLLGTTSSLIIWVGRYVASMIHHRLRPYREREGCTLYNVQLGKGGGAGEVDPLGEEDGAVWLKGGKLESTR